MCDTSRRKSAQRPEPNNLKTNPKMTTTKMTTTKNTRRTLTIRSGGNTLILWLAKSATSSDHARLVRIARRHGNSCGLVDWADLPESWRDGSALGPISPL